MDPEGIGAGKAAAVIFPIRCPECPLSEWADGIEDDVAKRILDENGMVQWVSTYLSRPLSMYVRFQPCHYSTIRRFLIHFPAFSARTQNVLRS